ncbi:signal peptidase I [Desmospora sp. 8437]|nr:signal peptidase I [Desmospora sp. 8437]
MLFRKRKRKIFKVTLRFCISMGIFLIGFLLFASVFDLYQAEGHSMDPTVHEGDWVMVRPGKREVNRGDLIVFRWEGIDSAAAKRVIGIPGDRVAIQAGQVYINEKPLDEPYVHRKKPIEDMPPIRVPEEHVFVLGDHRSKSDDSRLFGPVPLDNIKGHVVFILLPVHHTGVP